MLNFNEGLSESVVDVDWTPGAFFIPIRIVSEIEVDIADLGIVIEDDYQTLMHNPT